MPPKICSDADGDIPPCSVIDDFKSVERFEEFKQNKYEGCKRKAPCICRYFEGKIPEIHKCYKPVSKWKLFLSWIKLRAFRT